MLKSLLGSASEQEPSVTNIFALTVQAENHPYFYICWWLDTTVEAVSGEEPSALFHKASCKQLLWYGDVDKMMESV